MFSMWILFQSDVVHCIMLFVKCDTCNSYDNKLVWFDLIWSKKGCAFPVLGPVIFLIMYTFLTIINWTIRKGFKSCTVKTSVPNTSVFRTGSTFQDRIRIDEWCLTKSGFLPKYPRNFQWQYVTFWAISFSGAEYFRLHKISWNRRWHWFAQI